MTTDITPGASESFSGNLDAVVTSIVKRDSKVISVGSTPLPFDCCAAAGVKAIAAVNEINAMKRTQHPQRALSERWRLV